jgi:eukaryotic-like serine/threonine-protein kinase
MAVDPARAKSIFLTASDLADPAERTSYLGRECGDDAELRARVEALLRANDASPLPEPSSLDASRVSPPPAAETATHDGAFVLAPTADLRGKDERPGAVIAGKYTLVELIGEGGMGSVWRARQTEPVQRYVAVKLIRAGMDSRQVLARFDAERQAIALMDHPNIAKVLDGGLHEHRPYFVMELIKGVPVTDYCDRCKLTPKERLELFVQVCQAIQHAHQKGIIHRDIKPSNVLIALYDDRPVVKVIDFGVAKATGAALTERTLDTGFGAVVGTPEYMSPEQATFNNLDIDTRSDVYALGVLLYELLTGSPPFSKRELEKRGLLEMLRVVREEEPPRPSTRLSTAAALPTLSANRGTEPRKLTGLLRNELDWIVMKSLEKDRTRRYETAIGFAADVLRYLGGEAVQAHPPSTGYRVKKFVSRYKGRVVAASLVLAAITGGMVIATIGLVQAVQARRAEAAQREQAIHERDEKEQARTDAVAEKDRAERETRRANDEAAVARAVNEFLQNDLLRSVGEGGFAGGPNVAPDPNVTARALLDRAATGISDRFRDQPAVEAALWLVVAQSYQSLGLVERSLPHWRRAAELKSALFGRRDPEALSWWLVLAESTAQAGRKDDALRVLDDLRGLIDPGQGPIPKEWAGTLLRAAATYRLLGRSIEAKKITERIVLEATGAPDKLETREDVARAIGVVGNWQTLGRSGDADRLFEQVKQAVLRMEREAHPDAERALFAIADMYRDRNQPAEAVQYFERARDLWRRQHDPKGRLPYIYVNLVYAYMEAGRHVDAIPILENFCRRTTDGLGRYGMLNEQFVLSLCYRCVGRAVDAVPVLERLRDSYITAEGADGNDVIPIAVHLGNTYFEVNRHADALKVLESVLPKFKSQFGRDAELTRVSTGNLVQCYDELGFLAKAEPLRRDLVASAKRSSGSASVEYAGQLVWLGMNLLKQGKANDAEPVLRECLAIREKKEPDAWSTFNARSILGGALLGQKNYADAEPLLLNGYEGMTQREKTIPPQGATRIPEALDRLIELYTGTNKPDEAKNWRAERAKYPAPVERGPLPREKK